MGFRFERGTITTARKVEPIQALAETGLSRIQTVSFVDPRRVPGWADAGRCARRRGRHWAWGSARCD